LSHKDRPEAASPVFRDLLNMIPRFRFLPVLVFVVGTGSLGAEIAAVRLLAPYFGASTVVWANTIGVVLVALSVGYWLGGRWADRRPHMRSLCLLTLGAAVLLALVPFAADPLLDLSVKTLDSLSAGAFFGSLASVLLLVAVPILLLGAVSPWAIRLAVGGVDEAGRVAGRLYALSTAGSLVGTLASALVLIPLVGTRRTFLLFALVIAAVAVMGLRPIRRYAPAPIAIAVLLAMPVGTLKAAPSPAAGSGQAEGWVIFETETPYQYARVLENTDNSRLLELNEGNAVHSAYRPDTVLTGAEWDMHLVLPFLAQNHPPGRVAILGNAAGTTARAYGRFFPRTRLDGVELDPEISKIGRRLFDMRNPRLHLFHEDARPFLRRTDARYDAISIDAYRQPYIPFYLTTEEFFELARSKLRPGGVLILNATALASWQRDPRRRWLEKHELERVLTRTLREVFPNVVRAPTRQGANTLLTASAAPLSAEHLRRIATRRLPPGLQPTALGTAKRAGPPLPGGEVYTDDRAPVELLLDKSIIDFAAGSD
jgi:predicted membrane-bound spermidine synthase